ncbi:MAG: uroporphyrinogen decarboxylase family protein [Actinomycetota bacterium]
MEARERVQAAIALDVADRPPFGLWGHSYLDEWLPRDLAAHTTLEQKRYGYDFVKFQPRASCFAEAYGSLYRPSRDPLIEPILVRAALTSWEDLESLPEVGGESPPLAAQVEGVGRVSGAVSAIPVLQTLFSPITVAGYLFGKHPARALQELRDHPDAMERALDRIAGGLIDFAARSVEAGAAGVFYAISGYASADLISEEDYRHALLPHDRKVLEALPARAWFNAVHICGERIHFGLASDLPSQAVSWSIHEEGNPDLEDGVARSGRAAMGGLSHKTTLVRGTAGEVEKETLEALAANSGRGIFVAPGCSIPPEAPEANRAAVADAVRRHSA